MSIINAILSALSFIALAAVIVAMGDAFSFWLIVILGWLFLMIIVGLLSLAVATIIDSTVRRLRKLRTDPMAEPHGDAPKVPGR